METKIVLKGSVPSLKNSKNIVFNRATGKPFIMANERVKLWQNAASLQLAKYKTKRPYQSRVVISMMFYYPDNRRHDLDNSSSTVLDQLVRANILKDDSWQFVKIGGLDAAIDKQDPRCEIHIKPVDN